MNNRGQVLVMFVIFLPIFLLIISIVVDYGLLLNTKRKVSNNTYDAVEYYLENIEDSNVKNKTKRLLESNLNDISVNIMDENNYVDIEVTMKYKSLYHLTDKNSIVIKYRGIKTSKKIIKG